MSILSRDEARRGYDRIGALQDTQAFYEDRATADLVQHARFGDAHRVLEFGCGTGRFALRLLAEHLPEDASHRGLDLSPTMAPFGARAEVVLTDGSPPADEPASSRDRFVSNYVLDLLCEEDIVAVVREAHRILEPEGLLCLASLDGYGRGLSVDLAPLVARPRAAARAPRRLPAARASRVDPVDRLADSSSRQTDVVRCLHRGAHRFTTLRR